QVPDEEVIAAIQKRGISFKPEEKDYESMKGMGVEPPVIAALRKAKFVPAEAKPKSPYKKTGLQTTGTPDKAFASVDAVVEGVYGVPCIVHACMESHGSASEWTSDKELIVHISTQNVSGIAAQMAEPLNVPAGSINVLQQNIGGGFGSKFSADRWDINTANLSKAAAGKPVKNMLDRKAEFEVAGMRPSAYARVKIAADKDGKLVAWDSRSWGTGGVGGGGTPPLPYIFEIPNQPQAALITMAAIEDLAAKMKMDPLEFISRNLEIAGVRAQTYREEFAIADEMMGWKKIWHQRGDKTPGNIKRGLGLSMHTWGGRGHNSDCDFTIHPDGSVEIKMGTQDLGTGART